MSAPTKNGIIEITNIHKRYQMGGGAVLALGGVNLDVRRGEFVAIMGPSGSGKSTLMNIIGLLDRPDVGSYRLNGSEVALLDDDMRSNLRNLAIGFIFQNFNLLPRASALRNVMLPLMYRRMSDAERLERAHSTLDRVGLADRIDHHPSQLSGGECQRVAIARALVGEPSVILADEPTGNLDSRTGDEIITLLIALALQGQTVIMVTHDPAMGARADRVVKMLDGMII